MKIETQAELSKLLDLCRKKGVLAFAVDNLSFTLSDEAPPSNYKRKLEEPTVTDESEVSWDQLSPEEQLFYSSGALSPKAE